MGKDIEKISDLLKEISSCIEENRFSEIGGLLQGYVNEHPDSVDDRLQAEIAMIEKQMEYKSQLQDWEYFRMIKLVYQYCAKVYANDDVCRPNEFVGDAILPDRDVIWWCWLQGLEQAPDVVKACYRSLQKLGKKIVVLTEENMFEYVSFPDYIMEAKEKGIISRTHFSDLLRLELLTNRGGTWIDATVFCSGSEHISELLNDAELFCYSFVMRDSVSEHMLFDSWFLHCTNPSKILYETKKMLYEYWRRESNQKHYFLFHLFFSIACRRNPDEWDRIPIYSNEPVHILQLEMFKPYNEKRLKQIYDMTDIHKLTYKYDDATQLEGTFLEHLLNAEE